MHLFLNVNKMACCFKSRSADTSSPNDLAIDVNFVSFDASVIYEILKLSSHHKISAKASVRANK